jgi:hypothetical protein
MTALIPFIHPAAYMLDRWDAELKDNGMYLGMGLEFCVAMLLFGAVVGLIVSSWSRDGGQCIFASAAIAGVVGIVFWPFEIIIAVLATGMAILGGLGAGIVLGSAWAFDTAASRMFGNDQP